MYNGIFSNAIDRWLITTLQLNFPAWWKKKNMFPMADFLFLMKLYMTAGLLLNPRKQLSQ